MAKSRKGRRFPPKKPTGSQGRRDQYDHDSPRDSGESRSSLNDISWYARNPKLLAAAGSFPYPYRPGMTMELNPTQGANKAGTFTKVQSLMRLDWCPSFGMSSESTDPASIAAKEFYGRVREAFSGSIDADAPDFLVYIGALDSIYTYIGWLKRVYRAISTYSPDNFDLPDAILRASGFTADDDIQNLRQNKVRFWQMINELILMTRKFKCPAVMDMFNRHYWMSDNVYADQATLRAQLFMYNLVGVYKLQLLPVDDSSSNTAMGLQMTMLPTRRLKDAVPTVDSLYEFGLGLIQAMDAWDDGYLISGYLQRAFKDVPSFTIAELEQNELITASFTPEVLSQIENFRSIYPPAVEPTDAILTSILSQMTLSQRVTDNAVVTNPSVKFTVTETDMNQYKAWANLYDGGISPLLNVHTDEPTVADSVIASRMHAHTVWTTTSVANEIVAQYSCGTEVPLALGMYGLGINTAMYQLNTLQYYDLSKGMTYNDNWVFSTLLALQQFDWHPIILVVLNLFAGTAMYPAGDLYNPTVLSAGQIRNLHKICLYSELNSFGI
nr:putative capsid [Marmot picobirnavirus]